MGYADTDVAEFFYKKRPSVDELMKYLCNDLSRACSIKPLPVPKVFETFFLHPTMSYSTC